MGSQTQNNSVGAAQAQGDNRNMKRLKDEQQVRQRPAPIFGTNDEKGAFHSIEEIIANVVDEAREGYGKEMRVSVVEPTENDLALGADPRVYVVEVSDDGRGLPMDWNQDEQMYNWELALCTLYASGKYDSDQYSQSLGLNGLGLTATQYASSFMQVWSTYNNETRYVSFKKGKPIGKMTVSDAIRESTGTTIRFQPDPEVFPALAEVKLDASMFLTVLNTQAVLLAGFKIVFKHAELKNEAVLLYENGASEYIDRLADDKKLMTKTVSFDDSDTGIDQEGQEPYKVDMHIAFNFCRDVNLVQIYHNSSLMSERGKTVEGFESGITAAFTDFARNTGKLSRADRFLYKDIESLLICVASTDAPGHVTWFKNQTKGAINNPFIGLAFGQFVYNKVMYWLTNSKGIADKITAEVVVNKRAREESAEVSKQVIRQLGKAVNFSSKPKFFTDCKSKDTLKREIYIVEGRSALTSTKKARLSEFQAVMPLRGKPINCLKEKPTRVLANDIIVDLYRVFGCGIELKTKYIEDLPEFDLNKLKWGKIIICTDADVDGMHIRCLLLTMFYILSPSLLKAGKVFIAETPLYEITWKVGKDKTTKFAFNDKEKDTILAEAHSLGVSDSKINVQRSKGLGENDPEMMNVSTMNPLTRRLVPVEYPEDDSDLRMYFDALLGDDIETRRVLIEEYFDLVDNMAD